MTSGPGAGGVATSGPDPGGVATSGPGPGPGAGGRRQLTYAVVGCLAGAGLALFAATRTWAVVETVRAAPLPALTEQRTGTDLVSWLRPLALLGLAGAGAVLATRGMARRLVALVIAGCGLGVLIGVGYARGEGATVGWPVLAGVGGAVLLAGGVTTASRGRHWPTMGTRYEARPAGAMASDRAAADRAAADRVAADRVAADRAGGGGRRQLADPLQTWVALDRGEDPTAE